VSETNEGRKINISLVKQLTGADPINVRTLNSKPITFTPSHKLFLITNNRPKITFEDSAIWERVQLIEFNVSFVDKPKGDDKSETKEPEPDANSKPDDIDDPTKNKQRQRDAKLIEKLYQERPGILAWLVRGCLEWQRIGLDRPEKVKTATEQYQNSEDELAEFIAECLENNPGVNTKGREIYRKYVEWVAVGQDKYTLQYPTFGKRFKKHGFKTIQNNGVVYLGIAIRVKKGSATEGTEGTEGTFV
jgi:putative DNA primase/helicase